MNTAFANTLLQAFEALPSQKIFAKGDLLLRAGDTEKHVYYIIDGAVRVFLLTEHEEMTIRFGYKGSLINSLASFIKQAPSDFYIEAMRQTTVKIMERKQFLELVNQNADTQKQYIALLELLVTQQIEREIDLLTVSPVERFNRVLERSPDVFQHIPLKYIASYLRMTPETLSRIRNS